MQNVGDMIVANREKVEAGFGMALDLVELLTANGFGDLYIQIEAGGVTGEPDVRVDMQVPSEAHATTIRQLLGVRDWTRSVYGRDAHGNGDMRLAGRWRGVKVDLYAIPTRCEAIIVEETLPAEPAEVIPAKPERVGQRTVGYRCPGTDRPRKTNGSEMTDEEMAMFGLEPVAVEDTAE